MNNKFINRKHLSNRPGTSISVLAVLYMHSNFCRIFFVGLCSKQSLKAKDEWNSSFNFDLLNPEVILSTKYKKLDL